MIVRSHSLILLAVGVALGGCRRAEIASYRIPKETDPEMPAAANPPASMAAPAATATPEGATANADMARTAVATAQGAALTWTAPAHWKPKSGSAMRKGSYAIVGQGGAEADMSITAFPNDVGGELANVNRWRGQIQLPPIGEAELANAIVRHDHNGMKFGEVDLVGRSANPQRILGAWVAYAGATWFFKLTGPDALVAGEKATFSAFIDSVKPAAATPSAP